MMHIFANEQVCSSVVNILKRFTSRDIATSELVCSSFDHFGQSRLDWVGCLFTDLLWISIASQQTASFLAKAPDARPTPGAKKSLCDNAQHYYN